MTPELLNCPFCGGAEISHGHDMGRGVVQCHPCNAYVVVGDEGDAIAAWNHRTSAHPVTVEGAILDAQIRAFERGRIDTPDEIRDASARADAHPVTVELLESWAMLADGCYPEQTRQCHLEIRATIAAMKDPK